MVVRTLRGDGSREKITRAPSTEQANNQNIASIDERASPPPPPPDFLPRLHSEASRKKLWETSPKRNKAKATTAAANSSNISSCLNKAPLEKCRFESSPPPEIVSQRVVKSNNKRQWSSSNRTARTDRMLMTGEDSITSTSLQYRPEGDDDDEELFENEIITSRSSIRTTTGGTTAGDGSPGSVQRDSNNNNNDDDPSPNSNNNNNSNSTKKKLQPREAIAAVRDFCGTIVNDERSQLVIIILILINAIMMGIGTFDFIQNNPRAKAAFFKTDRAFLIIFTVELFLQFVYNGLNLFLDGWLVFDLVIIVLSWSLESLQIVRAFRVIRAFRLITRLDTLKNLIMAIFAVAPSMMAIIALLLLILYVYAVLCTELFRDLYREGYTGDTDYFGRLDTTLFTLFQMMTLENWGEIARGVMDKYYWGAWFTFSSFLVITSFILYSLVIAVVCDAVKVTEHHDEIVEHVRERNEARQRIMELEQRVSDMADRQSAIVDNLHLALRELGTIDSSEETMSSEHLDDDDVGWNNPDSIFAPPLVHRASSPSSQTNYRLRIMEETGPADIDCTDHAVVVAQSSVEGATTSRRQQRHESTKTSGIDLTYHHDQSMEGTTTSRRQQRHASTKTSGIDLTYHDSATGTFGGTFGELEQEHSGEQ